MVNAIVLVVDDDGATTHYICRMVLSKTMMHEHKTTFVTITFYSTEPFHVSMALQAIM